MCVHATVMRQQSGGRERLVVHLFSDLNTTAGHAFPNDDVPLREETVPIPDIRVTFRRDYRFRRLRLEPEGKELATRETPGGISVTVPRLDVHAMVVGELADEPAPDRPKRDRTKGRARCHQASAAQSLHD